jgi:hypothetical protein
VIDQILTHAFNQTQLLIIRRRPQIEDQSSAIAFR